MSLVSLGRYLNLHATRVCSGCLSELCSLRLLSHASWRAMPGYAVLAAFVLASVADAEVFVSGDRQEMLFIRQDGKNCTLTFNGDELSSTCPIKDAGATALETRLAALEALVGSLLPPPPPPSSPPVQSPHPSPPWPEPSPPPPPSPLPSSPSLLPPSQYAASLTIQGDGFCQDGAGNRYDWIAVTGKTFNDVSECAVACQATNCRGFTFLATWSCYIQYDEGTSGYPDTLMATITALDGPITGSSSQSHWTGTGTVQSTNGRASFGKCYTPP